MILFDKEETEELARQAQAGNRYAHDQLGYVILKMYEAIKSKPNWRGYKGRCEEMMYDEAIFRMTKGIDKWDPAKGMSFYSWMQRICVNAFCCMVKRHKTISERDPAKVLCDEANRRAGLDVLS